MQYLTTILPDASNTVHAPVCTIDLSMKVPSSLPFPIWHHLELERVKVVGTRY